jgi:hypothetical protein
LTASGEVLITPLNDGGAAAGDEILRPPVLVGPLKKGLAKWLGKVLKVDSFGPTEETCKPSGVDPWASDVGPASGSLTIE